MIYIAGPMTGLPDFNYPAFAESARLLRAAGVVCITAPELNSAHYGPGHVPGLLPPEEYFRGNLRELLDADGIAVLPGSERSIGVQGEVAIAIILGLPFHDYRTGKIIPRPACVLVSRSYR